MKIKICGVTHPEDAEYAVKMGANYIGMVFARQSKRRVSIPIAAQISAITKSKHAIPVGVFVEHTAQEIITICEQTGITAVQLHGLISKNGLKDLIDLYQIIYAVSVENNSRSHDCPSISGFIPLYDNSTPGSGIGFDWMNFSPPVNRFWMLAGGLNAENVATAIRQLKPGGVDVASGVEFPLSSRKNPALVDAFIEAVKNAQESL